MIEHKKIALAELELNEGQVEGLPGNPRQWTHTDIDNLAESIRETPELLEARGLIVYPHGGRNIVVGGNMRYSALLAIGAEEAPCIVLPADTSVEKLKEIVIKDNSQFGEWDMTELVGKWGDLNLEKWGVSVTKIEAVEKQIAEREDPLKVLSIELEPDEYYEAVEVLRGYDEDISEALKKALGL